MSLPLRRAGLLAVTLIALLLAGLLTPASAGAAVAGPRISIDKTSPNAAGWNNSDVAVRVSFSQLSDGIATLTGATTGSFSVSEGNSIDPFVISAEGSTKVTVSATNLAQVSSTTDFTVKIDKTAPVITSSTPQDGKAYLRWTTNTAIRVACADGLSGVAECKSVSGSTVFNPVWTGSDTYDFTMTDVAGNTIVRTAHYTVVNDPTIDNEAPVVSVTGATPNAAGWYGTKPNLSLTATDATGVKLVRANLDSVVYESATSPLALPTLGDGVHTLVGVAYDNFGNYGEVPFQQVRVDSTWPSPSVTGVNNNDVIVQGTPRSFVPVCTDATSGIASCQARVDGTLIPDGTPLPTNVAGAHQLVVSATDKAGHNATSTYNYTVTALPDTTNPTIGTITASATPDASGWFRGALNFTITAADSGTNASGISRIQWRYSDITSWSEVPTTTNSITVSVLREGQHTIEVRAFDRAGNVSTSVFKGFWRDATAPTVSLTGIAEGADVRPSSGTVATFSCADAGLAVRSCVATLDGAPYTSGAAIDTTVGTHVVKITATDASGLTTEKEVHFTVTADQTGTTPPPGDTGTVTKDPTANGPAGGGPVLVPTPPVKAASTTALKVKGRTATVTVREKSPASAKAAVKLTIKKGSKTVKTLKSTIGAKNRVGIRLPKLAKGTYTVTVTYSGNTAIAGSTKTVKVRIK